MAFTWASFVPTLCFPAGSWILTCGPYSDPSTRIVTVKIGPKWECIIMEWTWQEVAVVFELPLSCKYGKMCSCHTITSTCCIGMWSNFFTFCLLLQQRCPRNPVLFRDVSHGFNGGTSGSPSHDTPVMSQVCLDVELWQFVWVETKSCDG